MPLPRILVRTFVLALAVSVVTACNVAPSPSPRSKVLLVALDGLEWNLVIAMLAQGRLPNLARQIRSGTFGELETMHPSLSPAIWASVATGMRPKAHGIRGFIRSRGGRQELFTSRDRRTKALWNIATDHRLRSGVVGWWNTFPVEPLDGVMVAQSSTRPEAGKDHDGILKGSLHKGLAHQVEPEDLAERVLATADEVDRGLDDSLQRIFRRPVPSGDDAISRMWKESRWSMRADLQYERVALDLLAAKEPFDLFLVYFGGTDVLAHRFWRWAYPKEYRHPPDERDAAALGSIVTDYYEYMDGVVGRFVDAAPSDAVVVVMSDHGMVAANRKKVFEPDAKGRKQRSGSHGRTPAFFTISGPGIRASGVSPESLRRPEIPELDTIFDVAPTILALLDLPVGRDMPGAVLTSAITEEFLEVHPVRKIATHTSAKWFRNRSLPGAEVPRAEERLEQLRSLGYIE